MHSPESAYSSVCLHSKTSTTHYAIHPYRIMRAKFTVNCSWRIIPAVRLFYNLETCHDNETTFQFNNNQYAELMPFIRSSSDACKLAIHSKIGKIFHRVRLLLSSRNAKPFFLVHVAFSYIVFVSGDCNDKLCIYLFNFRHILVSTNRRLLVHHSNVKRLLEENNHVNVGPISFLEKHTPALLCNQIPRRLHKSGRERETDGQTERERGAYRDREQPSECSAI